MIHHSPLPWLCCRPDVVLLERAVFHLDPALVWFCFILCEAAVSVTGACALQGGGIPSLGGSSCSWLTIPPAWVLVQPARGPGGAKLGRAAWLLQGCLLTKGWQCLGGMGACLLSLASYKGKAWKLRCWHWTSRIQGRMRSKWILAALTSLHDTFPPHPD